VAQGQRLLLVAAAQLADHHRAGVDAHPRRDAHPVLRLESRVERLQPAQQLAPGAHRPLGVVLVGLRVAEVDQQPVAQVLHDLAAVAGGGGDGLGLVGLHRPAVGLGVELLGQRRRAHQIAEHHRQVAPLAAVGQRRGGC
jgi:hypothetical protein